MNKIVIAYEEITSPEIFVSVFPTMDDFRNWATTGTDKDINQALKVFEAHEMYEYCEILKQCLDGRKNT